MAVHSRMLPQDRMTPSQSVIDSRVDVLLEQRPELEQGAPLPRTRSLQRSGLPGLRGAVDVHQLTTHLARTDAQGRRHEAEHHRDDGRLACEVGLLRGGRGEPGFFLYSE